MDKVVVPPTTMEACLAEALQQLVTAAGLELHQTAAELVARFSVQLATKLAMAQQKHGYSDGWMERGHADHFRTELRRQVTKGDPLDVAAFCAFLWHHGDTAATGQAAEAELVHLRDRSTLLNVTLWRMAAALGQVEPPRPEADLVDSKAIINKFLNLFEAQRGFLPAWYTAAALPVDLQEVFNEVDRATRKFPTWPDQGLHALAILGEEYGELNRAMLQMVYEPHKVSSEEIRVEAIQTAAMALRLVMSLGRYRYNPSEQHSQGAQLNTRGA